MKSWQLSFAVLCIGLALGGCGKISADYGKTKGLEGRTSLNGFGALRTAYEKSGMRSRDVTRLTDRVKQSDVIVWTPQVLGSVDAGVTKWLERWLQTGQKTLVYVVPDSGSEADYWIEAARLAPPQQRIEYRKRAARSINQRMLWRLNRRSISSNGWFRIRPLEYRTPLGEFGGPWRSELRVGPTPDGTGNSDASDAEDPNGQPEIYAEFMIAPFDAKQEKTVTAPLNTAGASVGPTGPASPAWSTDSPTTPTQTAVTFTPAMHTEGGDVIVAELRSEKWKDSKIIVVAGGSLLTNYALSRPLNQRLAAQVIAASIPDGVNEPLAGFLTSDWTSVPISEKQPGVPVATGMELLTVWPLSLVTLHGVMLGLVICLMLLPIFGRPKKIDTVRHTDFGHHLDAVAGLMNQAGGEEYARARISEYFQRVRGETSGPWVLADPPADPDRALPLPRLQLKRGRFTASSRQMTDVDEPLPFDDAGAPDPPADPKQDKEHL